MGSRYRPTVVRWESQRQAGVQAVEIRQEEEREGDAEVVVEDFDTRNGMIKRRSSVNRLGAARNWLRLAR